MTDQEIASFYTDTLRRLLELGAGELVRDIESTVARGRLCAEVGGKSGTLQTPLSPLEALVVALHMLVAAVEQPVHVQASQEVLNAEIVWRFDELEPRQLLSDAGPASFPARTSSPVESPQRPELSDNASEALRASATALLTLVRELEEHGNADVD